LKILLGDISNPTENITAFNIFKRVKIIPKVNKTPWTDIIVYILEIL
jgi:hypothetical protein